MTWDTYLANGEDFSTLGCITEPFDAPYTQSGQRGDLPQYAGIDGAGYSDQPFDPGLLSFEIMLAPDCGSEAAQRSNLNTRFRNLRTICRPDRLSTLTRRMSFDSGNETHTANGKLLSITPNHYGPEAMSCLVEFIILDGCWFGGSEAVGAGSAITPTIKGDTRTYHITAVLSAGAVNPVVTNVTNGYSFSYVGTVPTGGVSVDVLTRQAKRVSDNGDVSLSLRWAKAQPFRLDPGVNTITDSSGTVALTYYPAYL
jgi:hypothetical protein